VCLFKGFEERAAGNPEKETKRISDRTSHRPSNFVSGTSLVVECGRG
jgi:hypothetical protein